MPVTLIVEPDPDGHRFQSVSFVVDHLLAAGTSGESITLLTSRGAGSGEQFTAYLAGRWLRVEEVFDDVMPSTRTVAREIADRARGNRISDVVVMEADQTLKCWWLVAAREFRGLGSRKPRIVFMLVRYPTALRLTDFAAWRLRGGKAVLAALAMSTRTLSRVAGFTGRADRTKGLLVKRVRDPEVCTAHSRDRARLRQEFGLPVDRVIVGLFGVITANKNAPLVLDALAAASIDADLLLGGRVAPDVSAWLESLPDDRRNRIRIIGGFLDNATLDKLVACVDVAPIVLVNPGPSGIMGKALAAGVPIVTAGSELRAREARATGGGEVAELSVDGIGHALRRALDNRPLRRPSDLAPATPAEFAATLLGTTAAVG